MVERSLEVHSSLSSSAAMDSPHACTTPARSGPTHRAGRSMHGIHDPPQNHGRSMTHGMTMPLVPVNQIDNRDLGEGV